MYLESMVDGVLKGLGEQLATFRYSLFDSVFRIAAIWLSLPQYGMDGVPRSWLIESDDLRAEYEENDETNKKPSPYGKVV